MWRLNAKPLLEGNENLAICWEYRYMFYDTFGRGVYKSIHTYTDLMEKSGFTIHKVSEANYLFIDPLSVAARK